MADKEEIRRIVSEIKEGDKVYLAVLSEDDRSLRSLNTGFDALQLIGLMTLKIQDVESQMRGIVSPTVITREVILDKQGESK